MNVTATYNRAGYTVFIDGEAVYSAGNNAWDSQASGGDELPLRTLRRFAIRTAREIAEEVGGRFCGVEKEAA